MPPTQPKSKSRLRHLVVVLGDQLNADSNAFAGFDPALDAVWMAEVAEESTHVWTHQARIALFLAAMRHFRDALRARGFPVHYRLLNDPANAGSLTAELRGAIKQHRPERLILVQPGEWRVQQSLTAIAAELGADLEIRPDGHFLCTREQFAQHVNGRKQLRMEFFYREMRRQTGILMDGDQPMGGAWNFDAENRESFGKAGPGVVPIPKSFQPDAITREVIEQVQHRFAKHPGQLEHFDWPVTRADALLALRDFIQHRLADFGKYQDAMWSAASTEAAQPYLFHSRLSAALNLKLLDPREVLAAAAQAYQAGRAPLASVEGFIRQILGWREYVRGIYWHFMPGYRERNELQATEPLPAFYWTGQTEMNCLRQALDQTLALGYAHHIQRLMVTGLFSLLLGVRPQAVHEWYLAVYVDAVEWVELPNTLGMSQFADGGLMASKPYVATGKYLQRMSNYCDGCRFNPAQRTGPEACPFTTLYWDFLLRHQSRLTSNQRMTMQLRNLTRLKPSERRAIQQQAEQIKHNCRGQ